MTSSTMKKSLQESQPKRHQSGRRANICQLGRPVFAEVAFRDWLKRGNRSISHESPAARKVMRMPYKHVKLVYFTAREKESAQCAISSRVRETFIISLSHFYDSERIDNIQNSRRSMHQYCTLSSPKSLTNQ